MAQKQEPKEERFYNGDGVDVTERIEKNKTKFFRNRQAAEDYAYKNNSYKYEIFNASTGSIRTVVGYGVPK